LNEVWKKEHRERERKRERERERRGEGRRRGASFPVGQVSAIGEADNVKILMPRGVNERSVETTGIIISRSPGRAHVRPKTF